jgi:acyl carrier protein
LKEDRRKRIGDVLLESGCVSLPNSDSAPLADHGLDSLTVVMVALRLEKEFSIEIPGENVDPGEFATLEKIDALIARLQVGPR